MHRVVKKVTGDMGPLELATVALIVVNTLLLLAAEATHLEMFEEAEQVCLWLFTAELVYRWYRAGFKPSVMLLVETVVIGLAFLPALAANTTLLRTARVAKAAHLLRHMTHLRLWRVIRDVLWVNKLGGVKTVQSA